MLISNDIDMKLHPYTNWIIKNKNVSTSLIKSLSFPSCKYFCRGTQQKIVSKIFILIKPKRMLFWGIASTLFEVSSKTFQK